ncbi:MAG: LptF/LptG family permease, partial [Caldimonas sp.]
MRTVRRLFYSDIVSSVGFVSLAFLSLFFFIDFIDDLGNIGNRGYTALNAAAYSLLLVPGHFYELVPIAVLIGAIYALARLAQTSQYTILRTGGLGPWRALSLLTSLGLLFALLTYVVGDYIAPASERFASELQAVRKGAIRLGRSGAWMKDHAMTAEGERSYSINVGSAEGGSQLNDVRIFEFDTDGRLLRRLAAASAQVGRNSAWTLKDVRVTRWIVGPNHASAPEEHLAEIVWPSTLSAAVVAAA